MLINVISLERRADRRLSLIKHLEPFGCLYRFWPGVVSDSPLPFYGITAAHKNIVRDAKSCGRRIVTIAEDDLRFSHQSSIDQYFRQLPDSYDIYFGMIYSGNIADRRITYGFAGMQFYTVHEKFYDTFLSADDKRHIDQWLGERCHLHEFYCCDPFICFGESGYSDNFNRYWKFEEGNLPRKLYRGVDAV